MPNQRKKLKVIPEPATNTRSIIAPDFSDKAVIRGPGNIDYLCGSCGIVLIENGRRGHLRDIVIRCGGCGAFNDTWLTDEAH